MSTQPPESLLFSYSDIFFSYYFSDQCKCTKMVKDHMLVYIYSGEYTLEEGNRTTVVKPGECVFLRRDNRVNMNKQAKNGEPFQGIFMHFKRPFLRNLFQMIEKKDIPLDTGKHKPSVVKLPQTPDITGLFHSMLPYFDAAVQPSEKMMNLKLMEGVYSLLNIDRRFFPTLFDFTEPWKIDILEYLNENFMYELSMEEIASFTGRSLSTFKRDFRKISTLSPQKWLIQKRLEAAHEMLRHEGKKVTDVYMEVGFKNLSHFSSAFKKQFGITPSSYN